MKKQKPQNDDMRLIPEKDLNPKLMNYLENKKIYLIFYYGDKNWTITPYLTKVLMMISQGHTGKIMILLAKRDGMSAEYKMQVVYDSLVNYIDSTLKARLDAYNRTNNRDLQKETIDYFLRRRPINYENISTEQE